jgi:hypothetical protein
LSSRPTSTIAEIAGELEVVVDLEPRVDHGGRAGRVVADEVRGAAEIVVRDLAEDHLPAIISRRLERAKTGRFERGKPGASRAFFRYANGYNCP